LIAACLLILIGMSVLPGCEGQDPTSPAAPPETASGARQTSPDELSLMQQWQGDDGLEAATPPRYEELLQRVRARHEFNTSPACSCATGFIDFETPQEQESTSFDPYMDSMTGVIFEVSNPHYELFLQRNSEILPCIPKGGDNQLLGCDPSGPVWAVLPKPLPTGTNFSVTFQTIANFRVFISLYYKGGRVGITSAIPTPILGICDNSYRYVPGSRTRFTISINSRTPVDAVRCEAKSWFVIDDFSFGYPGAFALDIEPNAGPNTLNLASKGVLKVALLGSADADVSRITLSTLRLENAAPFRYKLSDLGSKSEITDSSGGSRERDGYQDVLLYFRTQDVLSVLRDREFNTVQRLTLRGKLLGGTDIAATDCVLLLGPVQRKWPSLIRATW